MTAHHQLLASQLRGQPNIAHPSRVRVWLANRKLRTPGQLGMPVLGRDFLEHFDISLDDLQMLCDPSKTPNEMLSEGYQMQHPMVVLEVHRNNNLPIKPGFYLTPLTHQQVIAAYGNNSFFPRNLNPEVAREIDDWFDEAARHLSN